MLLDGGPSDKRPSLERAPPKPPDDVGNAMRKCRRGHGGPSPRVAAYDQGVPAVSLAIAFAVALVVLIPTRRLRLAGWSRAALTAYFLAVWLLGFAVAVVPAPARFLVPVLLVAYLAPFVTIRAGIDRLLGSRHPTPPPGPPRPPMKNVTPVDSQEASGSPEEPRARRS